MSNKYENIKWKKHRNGTSYVLIEDFLFERYYGSQYIDMYCHRLSPIYSHVDAKNDFHINQIERYNEVAKRLGIDSNILIPEREYEPDLNIFDSEDQANSFFFERAKFEYNKKTDKFRLTNSKELKNICFQEHNKIKELCLFYFANENEWIYRIGLLSSIGFKTRLEEALKIFNFIPKISDDLLMWINNEHEKIIEKRLKDEIIFKEREKTELEKEFKSLSRYLKKN